MFTNVINYNGFDPYEDLRSFANRVLEKIQEAAPYESSIRGELKLENGRYFCKLEIDSVWGKFSARSAAYIPEAALVKAENKINVDLKKFKSLRFGNTPEKDRIMYQKRFA